MWKQKLSMWLFFFSLSAVCWTSWVEYWVNNESTGHWESLQYQKCYENVLEMFFSPNICFPSLLRRKKKRHIITLSPNSWGRGGGRHVTKVWPGSVSRMVIGVFQDRTGGCPFCPPVSSGTGTWCGAWVLHSHLGLCSESHVLRMAK